jgi:peptidyl-prolyl cis-trans isomerase B (cyclophilin B)
MPKRSRRRGSKRSNRRTWIALSLLVIIAVSGIGVYAYTAKPAQSTSSTTSTITSVTTTSTNSCSTGTSASNGAQGDYAVIDTTQGTMVVQLYPNVAPKTVANFINLADTGFYNDLVWHRIVAGFVIQTGDPTSRCAQGDPSSWGGTGSSQTVPLEANSTTVAEGYVNDEGYLAMARGSSNDSGSSQFFINLTNNTSLNGQYTVFGKVITGLDVALAIGNLPVASSCASSGELTCPPVTPSQAEVLSIVIQETP